MSSSILRQRKSTASRIVHFGNDAMGQGGIATVIRWHLSIMSADVRVDAVATYLQDGDSFRKKNARIIPALLKLLRLERSGTVIHIHLSHGGSYVREGGFLIAARVLGFGRIVVTLHSSELQKNSTFALLMIGLLLRSANVIHVLHHGAATMFRGKRMQSRICVIPNSVEVPSSRTMLRDRECVVAFVGEIGYRKGVDTLLAAWGMLNTDWRLCIAGPLSEDYALPDAGPGVEYLGALGNVDAISLMSSSRIVVLPSRAENFPMSVCEAVAHGCVVVATDVGGTRELIVNSDRLIAPGRPDKLAAALDDAMQVSFTPRGQSESDAAYLLAVRTIGENVVRGKWQFAYGFVDR